VDKTSKRKLVPAEQPSPSERRRIGTVVHDDRGNASVTWRDAPVDMERPVLEILGDPGLTIKHEDSFDPYARAGRQPTPAPARKGGAAPRTDLRKLSEWIKMMRELEERKKTDGGD